MLCKPHDYWLVFFRKSLFQTILKNSFRANGPQRDKSPLGDWIVPGVFPALVFTD